jgi:AsmA protein
MPVSRKLLVAICAPILVLLVAAPAALWLLLDPDDLKGRAAAYVKEQTGRDLTMNGPVSVSFFPWVGAELRAWSSPRPPDSTVRHSRPSTSSA